MPGERATWTRLFSAAISPARTAGAAVTLLYGLVAFGQIALRRIDGHARLAAFLAKEWSDAA